MKKNVIKKTSRTNKKGRVKTGSHCPARILVKRENGIINVTYIASHSHTLEFSNTRHQPLPSKTMQAIKQQLVMGVPPREVQTKLRQGISSCKTRKDGRVLKQHLITLRRLNEMKRRLIIRGHCHKEDAVSVMMKMQQLRRK